MNSWNNFTAVIERLLDCTNLIDFNAKKIFQETEDISLKLTGAFLLALGNDRKAEAFLEETITGDETATLVQTFLLSALECVKDEILEISSKNNGFEQDIKTLLDKLECENKETEELLNTVRTVFFPEGAFDLKNWSEECRKLRERRGVNIESLNSNPVTNAPDELLFTSNVLLTLPSDKTCASVDDDIKDECLKIAEEKQLYWFDHPVQIGTPPESNEIIYGLNALSSSLDFEKKKGVMGKDEKIDVVLSVSVTHRGIHGLHRQYIRNEIKKAESLNNIRVYAFSEEDTERILEDVIVPFAQEFFPERDSGVLCEVFGVDGEYGRHYSFLKAVSILWKLCVKPQLKGTFKIDLDQVFPQEKLLEETGKTALEHLSTPLWGATGRDSQGKKVQLGMIAGALINEKDSKGSVFTPDVIYNKEQFAADKVIFCSPKPQALSTEAEMMTRYGESDNPDGISSCLQRIHVTGGTNGILLDALLKYRPFTPTLIGRAEDQAYIMSVLFNDVDNYLLRYVHKDGLIMRHDKEAFAGEAIEAARLGKMVGDYVRILHFSAYARSLPWGEEHIKNEINPFTGSFISHIPLTITVLRAALKTCSLAQQSGSQDDAKAFISMVSERLEPMMKKIHGKYACLKKQVQRERDAWNLFYDVCDKLLSDKDNPSSIVKKYIDKTSNIIQDTCIHA